MDSLNLLTSANGSDPAAGYPSPPSASGPDLPKAPAHAPHHHSVTPPPLKIPMVAATMGAAPAQMVEVIQLLAGIPMPANLGPNIDTTA